MVLVNCIRGYGEIVQPEKIHVDSYYASTANRTETRPRLEDDIEVDVCVVGAGFSGLSTALALSEHGFKVCVLEAKAIGWGASGRNGGQLVNGLNASLPKIRSRFGDDTADFVGHLIQEGGELIRERIRKYKIECDYQHGNVFVAYKDSHMRELEAKQKLWRKYGMDDHVLLNKEDLAKYVISDAYVGGMLDETGGHLHPLNLALGEASAIESLGGVIYEKSEVTKVETTNAGHEVLTNHGKVKSKIVVLCGNAYLSGVMPSLEWRVMPVSTQIVTTQPLGAEEAKSILPTNVCVEDTRYILDYYRLTADNRLLFGGGTVYGGADPTDIRKKIAPNMKKVFPQIKNMELEYAWSGNFALSYTRVPQMGKMKQGLYFTHGYSGHGVTGSHLFGKILADAINGDSKRFDVFSDLPYLPFPGGRALRVPYSMVGSWWYAMRDKLGV